MNELIIAPLKWHSPIDLNVYLMLSQFPSQGLTGPIGPPGPAGPNGEKVIIISFISHCTSE